MIKKVSNCLNIVFMGTPAFSIPTLNTLIESPHNLKCVYTQPAKPSGRGLRKQFSHIHKVSNDRGINIRTPKIISDDNEFIFLQACDLDIIIVVAYGLILPSEILLLPKYGCLNIHASILPRWRGAAPIQRAIMEGDEETGISYMLMEEGLDSGPVLKIMKTEIRTNDDYGLVHDRLSNMASESILQVLEEYTTGKIKPKEQSGNGAIYANKIQKSEAKINWNHDAESIKFLINAMSPVPGAWTLTKDGKRLKILKATVEETEGNEGIVLDKLVIGCGKKSLRIIEVQPEGKKVMPIEEFLKGYEVKVGSKMFN